MNGLKSNEDYFKNDSRNYGKPLQLMRKWSGVEARVFYNQAVSRSLDQRQFVRHTEEKII